MTLEERSLEVGAWLSRAREDLRAASVGLDVSPPLLSDAAFHCQQAVEKALKALLTWHAEPFRNTHDIGELAVVSLAHEPSMEGLLRTAAPFTEYAWRFRHPGEPFEPDRVELDAALTIAREVVARVERSVEAR